MAAASSSSASWVGAAPISEGGFSFANGVFFAEASGKNQHRRATPEELAAHFATGSERDHPAHWFEAQLAHYGLRTSRTKSVARMRLFDAFRAGPAPLIVPTHIALLEAKLKKEWTKQDRVAKKSGPGGPSDDGPGRIRVDGAIHSSQAPKRRADEMGGGSTSAPATTRVKQTARRGTTSRSRGSSRQETVKARRPSPPPAPSPSPSILPAPPSDAPKKYRTKQTARCNRARGSSTARGRIYPGDPVYAFPPSPSPPPLQAAATTTTTTTTTTSTPRPKQTARCRRGRGGGASSSASGRIHQAPDSSHNSYSSFPSPKKEETEFGHDHGSHIAGHGDQLAPLGLINGRYDIDCPPVDSNWPHYRHSTPYSMVLRLQGSSVWGTFELGVISGVIHLEQRPYASSSQDALPFTWRGQEDQGPIFYGSGNRGWIRFLGGGQIEGEFEYQGLWFRGERGAEWGTMSEVSTRSLRDEWEGYTEERYDMENSARW